MPTAAVNGIRLEYETFGPEAAPAILLIMGLGAQMIRWNQELCDLLVARGYRVIRFDNRDCGRSSRCDGVDMPRIGAALRSGTLVTTPYTLDDMAADCLGLLDTLGVARAHIVGASMGSAIGQIIAARYPERTLSLTSIMSSSGNPLLPPPTAMAALALFAPLPPTLDKASMVADGIRRHRALASPGYPTDAADLERLFSSEYDRGFNPAGVARQLAAILANGDRRSLLQTIRVPTVVLHGADDPLIPPACGEDVAQHIPGAELRLIPGMGHDFPVALSTVFADAICAAAQRAAPG